MKPLLVKSSALFWLLPKDDDDTSFFLRCVLYLWTRIGVFYITNISDHFSDHPYEVVNKNMIWAPVRIIMTNELECENASFFYFTAYDPIVLNHENIREEPFRLDLHPLRLWKSSCSMKKKKMMLGKIFFSNVQEIIYVWNIFLYNNNRMDVLKQVEKHVFSFINTRLDSIHQRCDFQNLTNTIYSLLDSPKIQPVGEIQWEYYVGGWTQVIGNPISVAMIEQFGTQNKAYYTLSDNDTILIKNTQIRLCGKPAEIKGKGEIVRPGYLRVRFGENENTADYYILALGPVADEQYRWAVISDPFRLTLFVLIRDETEFETSYKNDVMRVLRELGFSYIWNSPVRTN